MAADPTPAPALAARVQALEAALRRYGRHESGPDGCRGDIAGAPCTCGLTAALATPTPPAATDGAAGLRVAIDALRDVRDVGAAVMGTPGSWSAAGHRKCHEIAGAALLRIAAPPAPAEAGELRDATCSACGTANTYRSGGCYPKWCGGCGAVLLAAPPAPSEAGVLNVCDTCEAHYRPTPPHFAHACKRVACGTDCPHPEMCEAAGSCPPSLIPGAERTATRPGGGPVAIECPHGYDHCPECDAPRRAAGAPAREVER